MKTCFPGGSVVKNPPANAGDARDVDSIPGSGRSPGGGNGNLLRYSCLENSNGQRSLVGYSPRGHTESDTTEHTLTHTHTGHEDSNGSRFLHIFCTGRGARRLHGGSDTRQQCLPHAHTTAPTLGLAPAGQSGIETPHLLLCVYSVTHSCLTLCDPMDCSPPGSSVHGILQARTLEWVAVPFSRASSQPRD